MSVGGIIGGVVDSIFGGGSSGGGGGGGGGDAWVTAVMTPGSYASATALAQQQNVTWQSVLAGLVGTYALVRNYQLQKRMVDLHQRSVDQAEEYLKLAKRHYDEITVPTYERVREHFDHAKTNWRPKLLAYIDEGLRLREYTPDYTSQMGRFMSAAQAEIGKVQHQRQRMRSRFGLGAACYEDALMSIRGAELRVAAASAGYRYEDQKKIALDQWYWQRWSAVAELVSAGVANALSALNGGAATATTGLSQVGVAVDRGRSALAGLSTAMGDQRDWWGTQAQGYRQRLGINDSEAALRQQLGASSTVSPSVMAAITGGPVTNSMGILNNNIGTMGDKNRVLGRNEGAAPV